MRAFPRAHASTLATSLMRVKNGSRHFCLWHMTLIIWDIRTKKMKERWKTLVNAIISLAYIKRSPVSLLELRQNNLGNPEAYSELFQTSKMKCFAKVVNG